MTVRIRLQRVDKYNKFMRLFPLLKSVLILHGREYTESELLLILNDISELLPLFQKNGLKIQFYNCNFLLTSKVEHLYQEKGFSISMDGSLTGASEIKSQSINSNAFCASS